MDFISALFAGTLIGLLEPLKWIFSGVAVILVCNKQEFSKDSEAAMFSAWFAALFAGALGQELFQTAIHSYHDFGDGLLVNATSSAVIASILAPLRKIWLEKSLQSKDLKAPSPSKDSVATGVTVGSVTVKAGWDAKANPFPTGDESKGKTTKFTVQGEIYWDTKLKNAQVIKNTSTKYDSVQTVRKASGRWYRNYYLEGKGVAPPIKLSSSDPVSGLATGAMSQKQVRTHRGKKDEKLYEVAWRELEEGTFDEGLWARLLAEHDGDEAETRADYLRTRVQRLNSQKKSRKRLLEKKQRFKQRQSLKNTKDHHTSVFAAIKLFL